MRVVIILLIILIFISLGIFINGIRNSNRRTIHEVTEDNEHDDRMRKRSNCRKKVTIIEEMPDNNDNTVE